MPDLCGIQAIGRLVEHEDAGPMQYRLGNTYALSVPAGQRTDDLCRLGTEFSAGDCVTYSRGLPV
jgi:hypothetical protein